MKRTTLYGIPALLMAGLLLAGCATAQPTPVKPTPTAAAPGSGGSVAGQRIISEGRVRPLRSAELSFSAGGLVTEVLVSEGQAVKKDQPLARLDSRLQTAAAAQAEAALARAKSARLAAQAGLSAAQAALADLQPGSRVNDIAAARAGVQSAEAQLALVQAGADPAQFAAAQAAIDKATRAVAQAQTAYDNSGKGPAESLRLEQATIDYQAAKAQYDLLAALPRPADLAVAKARLAQAQASLAQVSAGGTAEAVKAATAAVAAAEAQVTGSAAEIASAEAALALAKATLADTELRAPFDGVVFSLNVKAGEPAPVAAFAVRVADASAWRVETTDLTELNVIRVAEGAPVSLTFDAVPGMELTGKVVQVKPYGEIRQGDIVYTVVVALDKQDPRLRWNMTAKVGIDVK